MTEFDVQRRLEAVFEASGAGAAEAVTRGDIARVVRQLDGVWHREQPGAIVDQAIRDDLFRRYKDLTVRLAERRRAICTARPVEERTIIDRHPRASTHSSMARSIGQRAARPKCRRPPSRVSASACRSRCAAFTSGRTAG